MVKTTSAARTLLKLLLVPAIAGATASVADAQPFFRGWGGYYAAPSPFFDDDDYDGGPYVYRRPPYGRPGPFYAPGSGGFAGVGADEIARQAAAAGFRLVSPPRVAGRTLVALGDDRSGRRHRLVFDAGDGRLIGASLTGGTRRAAAVGTPRSPAAKRAPVVTPAKADPGTTQPAPSPGVAPAGPTPAAAGTEPPSPATRVRVDKDPLALPPATAEGATPPRTEAAPSGREAPRPEAGVADTPPPADTPRSDSR